MSDVPKELVPFPLDFDLDEGPCLVCGGQLDLEWRCTECGADHFEGVMLIIGYGTPPKGVITSSAAKPTLSNR
ncbi:hypothetical protein E4L95_07495 [Paracoccus liaowanqingii]|uniref:Uncharacterized protein n=1 Tax=Paracoccus liaowanqingii TaxID=2560053 RepID=A0A4Z1CHC9_9RHOB|nr:hypothetical protein [Paracoccus liaowanqingii]TGN62212.1 hypothetical protein E4L95_07495 [Paracoccus liaowanqingii]